MGPPSNVWMDNSDLASHRRRRRSFACTHEATQSASERPLDACTVFGSSYVTSSVWHDASMVDASLGAGPASYLVLQTNKQTN